MRYDNWEQASWARRAVDPDRVSATWLERHERGIIGIFAGSPALAALWVNCAAWDDPSVGRGGKAPPGSEIVLLLIPVSVVAVAVVLLAAGLSKRWASGRARRAYRRVVDEVQRKPTVGAGRATEGEVRITGRLRRAPDHDPFDPRFPVLLIEDETGFAVIDDDCLLLVGLRGALPPDGTLVDVVGRGARRPYVGPVGQTGYRGEPASAFVLDGSPASPVLITPHTRERAVP